MLALEIRRLLAPSLAPRLTRPGILNTTWKPLTSAAACCSAASNAHSSTPRLSRMLLAVGAVVDGSISTTMSSFSLTGNWSSIAILIGKSWPLRIVVLNERSSVFDVVTIRPADPSLRLRTVRSTLTLSSAPKPSRTVSSLPAAAARFKERGRIQHRHGAYCQIGRDARTGDAQALGPFAGA